MKKLILCACCVCLSEAAVQALSFRNDADQDATVDVHLQAAGLKVAKGKRVSRIGVDLGGVLWRVENQRSPTSCDFKGKTVSLFSDQTIVFKGTAGNYSCTIE